MLKRKNKTQSKLDFLENILSLPTGALKNYPSIHIKGNREIIIDGCTGLLNYDTQNIMLETKHCKITISGRSLNIYNLTSKILSVKGFIQKFEFLM